MFSASDRQFSTCSERILHVLFPVPSCTWSHGFYVDFLGAHIIRPRLERTLEFLLVPDVHWLLGCRHMRRNLRKRNLHILVILL